jgi:hypothetical protein
VAAEVIGTGLIAPPRPSVPGSPRPSSLVEIYRSVPFSLDAPTNVTLLGDALHPMTPTLGSGANVASARRGDAWPRAQESRGRQGSSG